jgi:N-acetylmuramoyl-L-alanine amidase
MPAVLVEMGFITNPEQEAQLLSDGHQSEIVQALAEAVIQFRDGRVPPSPETPREHP